MKDFKSLLEEIKSVVGDDGGSIVRKRQRLEEAEGWKGVIFSNADDGWGPAAAKAYWGRVFSLLGESMSDFPEEIRLNAGQLYLEGIAKRDPSVWKDVIEHDTPSGGMPHAVEIVSDIVRDSLAHLRPGLVNKSPLSLSVGIWEDAVNDALSKGHAWKVEESDGFKYPVPDYSRIAKDWKEGVKRAAGLVFTDQKNKEFDADVEDFIVRDGQNRISRGRDLNRRSLFLASKALANVFDESGE